MKRQISSCNDADDDDDDTGDDYVVILVALLVIAVVGLIAVVIVLERFIRKACKGGRSVPGVAVGFADAHHFRPAPGVANISTRVMLSSEQTLLLATRLGRLEPKCLQSTGDGFQLQDLRACARACVHACLRACVRAYVQGERIQSNLAFVQRRYDCASEHAPAV